jgi:hypothetical protein
VKDELELAINERLLTVHAIKVQSLENTVKKEVRVFEDEEIRKVNLSQYNNIMQHRIRKGVFCH